jgi:hypothetical protein
MPVSVLVSCAGSLPHPPYAPQSQAALTAIDASPPPGRVEQIPEQPPFADAWISGEWTLRHGRWYWLLGRWVKTPAGARYSPWVMVRAVDGSTFYAPGVWQNAKGATVPAPAGVAFATASGEAVLDAEGEVQDTGRAVREAPGPRAPSR